jgi:biopolymer transport protein ExbD
MGPMQGGGLNREPNVVPMIDILLVLLISAILGLLPGWKTELMLPVPAESDTPIDQGPQLVLSVAPGPIYALNGQPIARDRLVAELTKVYEGRPDKTLYIDAARSMRYQDVFWIYGAVRSAGVTVTAIVPPETRRAVTSQVPR